MKTITLFVNESVFELMIYTHKDGYLLPPTDVSM